MVNIDFVVVTGMKEKLNEILGWKRGPCRRGSKNVPHASPAKGEVILLLLLVL